MTDAIAANEEATTPHTAPMVRRIGIADLRAAVSRGIDDFLAAPTQLLFLGVIYPVVGFAAARRCCRCSSASRW